MHNVSHTTSRNGPALQPLVCVHILDEIRHGIGDTPELAAPSLCSFFVEHTRVTPGRCAPGGPPRLPPKWPLSCMFPRLRSHPMHLDAFLAVPEAQYITYITLPLLCAVDRPPGFHDWVILCVPPAQSVKRGPISTLSSTLNTRHAALPEQFSALSQPL